jgi:death-on-curing protein
MNGNPQPWDELITIDRIVWLHTEDINRFGGGHSDPKTGCVEGSAGGAYNAGLYNAKNDPPEAIEIALAFAGYLLFYLAKNHCFVDGNKRVAWSACMEVLGALGLTLDADQEVAEEFVDAVVNDRIDNGHDVVLWLEEHLVSIH